LVPFFTYLHIGNIITIRAHHKIELPWTEQSGRNSCVRPMSPKASLFWAVSKLNSICSSVISTMLVCFKPPIDATSKWILMSIWQHVEVSPTAKQTISHSNIPGPRSVSLDSIIFLDLSCVANKAHCQASTSSNEGWGNKSFLPRCVFFLTKHIYILFVK
jgi:hypothetical protein